MTTVLVQNDSIDDAIQIFDTELFDSNKLTFNVNNLPLMYL